MEFKTILYLTAAIVWWLYGSYRNYKKQEQKKAERIPVPEQIPVPKVVKRQTTEIKKVVQPVAKSIKQLKPVVAKPNTFQQPVTLESIKSDIPQSSLQSNIDVFDAAVFQTDDTMPQTSTINLQSEKQPELAEEIRSGNIDWRKAIVLGELVRPVYF